MDGAAEAEGAREEWSKRVDEAEGGVEVPLRRASGVSALRQSGRGINNKHSESADSWL